MMALGRIRVLRSMFSQNLSYAYFYRSIFWHHTTIIRAVHILKNAVMAYRVRRFKYYTPSSYNVLGTRELQKLSKSDTWVLCLHVQYPYKNRHEKQTYMKKLLSLVIKMLSVESGRPLPKTWCDHSSIVNRHARLVYRPGHWNAHFLFA